MKFEYEFMRLRDLYIIYLVNIGTPRIGVDIAEMLLNNFLEWYMEN